MTDTEAIDKIKEIVNRPLWFTTVLVYDIEAIVEAVR